MRRKTPGVVSGSDLLPALIKRVERHDPAQKFRRHLPIRDTRSTPMATSRVLEEVMQGMIRKATEVLTATAGLYREMTVSALRLVPRRN